MPKRKVAQDILNTNKDFQVIFFLMPDGDIYLIEPYSQQQNLTGNNGLNLTSLSESLQAVSLTNNEDGERIVIVDHQGQKIVDSSGQSILSNSTLNESFADLRSFSNAINDSQAP